MQDIEKALLSTISVLVGLILTWLIGIRVSTSWAIRQKRRESVHSALQAFQNIYGRWLAIAKSWNLHLAGKAKEKITEPVWKETSWLLLREVLTLEGELESLLLKLCAQYTLDARALTTIECFREGFQVLRQGMVAETPLPWFARNSDEYHAFKRLAAELVGTLTNEDLIADTSREPSAAATSFQQITSNRLRSEWHKSAK